MIEFKNTKHRDIIDVVWCADDEEVGKIGQIVNYPDGWEFEPGSRAALTLDELKDIVHEMERLTAWDSKRNTD